MLIGALEMKGSPRQLFAATLLASAVVTLAAARPLLSPTIANAKPFATRRVERLVALRRLDEGDSIARVALAQLGTRYVLGGTTPDSGFDCSGLVRYVYARSYWTLPRTAQMQALTGSAIDTRSLMPGDLLTFGDGPGVTHIGIYVGEGMYVHASSVAGRVILSRVDRQPTKLVRPMKGARRLLALAWTPEQLAPGADASAGARKVQRAQRVDQLPRATRRVASNDPGRTLHGGPKVRTDHVRSD